MDGNRKEEVKGSPAESVSRKSSFNRDIAGRQNTLDLELAKKALEQENAALRLKIQQLEKGENFANVLTQSPLDRNALTSSYFPPTRDFTGLTAYDESDVHDDDKIEIEGNITQEKYGKNRASTHLNDIFTVEDINKGEVTSWALYQFHKRYQEFVREELKKANHLSSAKLTDKGLEIVDPEDTSKYIRDYIRKGTNTDANTDADLTIAIANMERDLRPSENFRKKGENSLNYMVKRADDHELEILVPSLINELPFQALQYPKGGRPQ